MAIELQRLMEKVAHMDVTLLAGKNGIHNPVTWVHMVETMEASDFLQGGEIAFTTGLGLGTNVDLLELITFMKLKNVSGVIVNTGPFIEYISEEVIDFCNENDFPLYVVPWKIHLAEIMRIFCFAITKDEESALKTASGFKNAIFFPKQEDLYIISLSRQGFATESEYSVCVINLDSKTKDLEGRLESLAAGLNIYCSHKYTNYAIFVNNKTEILIITCDYNELMLHSFILDIKSRIAGHLSKNESVTIGCGKITKSIRCLYKSYSQAKSIAKLHLRKKIPDNLIFYSDMGIYKLLMSIDDKEILIEYCSNILNPIIEYDKKHDSDYLNVLKTYLCNNGSVQETADLLYLHRNTVNYKLSRISELMEMDLSKLDTRLQLMVGYMILDII